MSTSVENQFAVALESTWGTRSADTYYPLKMTRDPPDTTTETEELDLATGQVGAEPEVVSGARRGTFTIKGPIEVFKQGWDGTSDTPAADKISPMIPLICHALGAAGDAASTNAEFFAVKTAVWSKILPYVVNGVTAAGTDSTHIEVDALGTIGAGDLLSAALVAAQTTVQIGFAKSAAANVVALFEAARQLVASNDAELFPTITTWNSIVDRKGLTFKWRGNQTQHAVILTGCCPESITFRFPAGKIPECEIKYRVAGWIEDTSAGGLTVPAAMVRCAALTNEGWAQLTLGGTAKCGVVDPEITITNVLSELPCHGSGSQGISGYRVDRQQIRAKFKIAWDSTDALYDAAGVAIGAPGEGLHKWENSIREGTKFSLGVYGGAAIGRIFALLATSLTVRSAKRAIVLGAQGFDLELAGSTYSGDTAIGGEVAATSPINSLVRAAWG